MIDVVSLMSALDVVDVAFIVSCRLAFHVD